LFLFLILFKNSFHSPPLWFSSSKKKKEKKRKMDLPTMLARLLDPDLATRTQAEAMMEQVEKIVEVGWFLFSSSISSFCVALNINTMFSLHIN
jgi:hypothetical protein